MTISELLSKPEFWSALFGALAAFLLGVLATWWANLNTKRTAGNLAIIALSQMYSLLETVRHELLLKEPIRIHEILKRGPFPFEIRPAAGLPERLPRINAEDLGFLADSHDPDILNRLLTVERAFAAMIDVLRRHELAHAKITEKMNTIDPTGQRPFGPEVILQATGAKVLIEVDVLVEALEKGLPETRDMLLQVGKQLRDILRMQIPVRRFVGFSAIPRTRLADQPPDLPEPPLWRRMTRWSFDLLMRRRRLPEPSKAKQGAAVDLTPPAIRRFPPRSWENREPSGAAMAFQNSGFLATDAPWILQIRQQQKAWFELISKLNGFAVSVLLREVPKVAEELYVAALYARAVTTFQGAVLLAERGMAAESRTLVRACAETAIALGCSRRDKSFPEQLNEDHDKHRIAAANDLLTLPEDDPNISPEQRADLRQLISEVTAQYQPPRPRRINWAAASSTAAMTDLYLTVYRQTSGDAAHVTLRALDRHIVSDKSGTIVGFQFRPYPEEVADTLSSSIAALFHATEAKVLGLGDKAADEALRALAAEWRGLVEASG